MMECVLSLLEGGPLEAFVRCSPIRRRMWVVLRLSVNILEERELSRDGLEECSLRCDSPC